MPELPEVQTVVTDLQSYITGKKIKSVEVKVLKLINLSKKKFKKNVEGAEVLNVSRRAKMIVISLDNDYFLLVHLKMTGQLIFLSKKNDIAGGGHPFTGVKELPNKFSHIIFEFIDKSRLFFNDVRRFGWVRLLNKKQIGEEFKKLGIEPAR